MSLDSKKYNYCLTINCIGVANIANNFIFKNNKLNKHEKENYKYLATKTLLHFL